MMKKLSYKYYKYDDFSILTLKNKKLSLELKESLLIEITIFE